MVSISKWKRTVLFGVVFATAVVMTKIMMFAVMGTMVGSAQPVAVTDDEIRDMVVHSGFYIDNGLAAREEFLGAKELCAGDTNRFARILCELAQTNHVRIADRMIRCLGRHGTTAQLPFLYSMATNEQHGASAVKSILRLEGVTSNSVTYADMCLSMKRIMEPERLEVCRLLLNLTYADSTPSNAHVRALSYIYNHARTCDYPAGLDQSLIRHDPGYRQSRRRLSILRDVHLHGVDQWDIAYVTNAINELVGYPEADLPE